MAALHKGGPVYLMDEDTWDEYEKQLHAHWHNGTAKPKITSFPVSIDLTNFDEYGSKDSWWPSYHCSPSYSRELATQFYNDLEAGVEIDWEATTELLDHSVSVFNGTFAENSDVPLMVGILVMKNGNKYPWVTDLKIKMDRLKDILEFIDKWKDKDEAELRKELQRKFEEILTRPNPHSDQIYIL